MSGQQESNWPTWKLALAISVPVAVGGVLYYQYVHKKKGTPPSQQPFPTSGVVTREDNTQKESKDPPPSEVGWCEPTNVHLLK